jgi:hypothetical protein
MRTLAGRLTGRSYTVSKHLALVRMRRNAPPVVVFSMGKTGSTAIARAVHDATGDRVFQVFRLDADRLKQAEGRYRVGARPPFPGAMHLWESEYLLRRPPTSTAPWTVITTVREPIAQAVSAFFHGSVRRGVLHDDATTEILTETLLTEHWIRAPLRWFDREFVPAFGLEVFSEPFDPTLGYATVAGSTVRVLLLRQENLAVAPDVLAQFLGRQTPVAVPARNEATTKDYGAHYRQFLASVRLPGPVLDEAYASRYARHFYADHELERFRQRWTEGSEASASSA